MFRSKKVLGIIVAIAAFMIAFSTTIAFYDDHRPRPTRVECIPSREQTREIALICTWYLLLEVQNSLERCIILRVCSSEEILKLKWLEQIFALKIHRIEQEEANLK